MDNQKLLYDVLALAEQVAAAILPIYHQQTELTQTLKEDGSPLTQADLIANQLISEGLQKLRPGLPIISEESCDIPFVERRHWERYWLIDPIDGTKEFLAHNGEFTINIALIEHHRPILGVINAPALGTSYFAEKAYGAFKKQANQDAVRIHIREVAQPNALRMVASRRHGKEAFASLKQQFKEIDLIHCGSSLKFCLVAEGKADLYPRLGITSEWDTAAAQCVLECAGGKVTNFDGLPLQYNTRDSYQNPYFIAFGDQKINWLQYFKS